MVVCKVRVLGRVEGEKQSENEKRREKNHRHRPSTQLKTKATNSHISRGESAVGPNTST